MALYGSLHKIKAKTLNAMGSHTKKWYRFDETNCGGPIKFGLEEMSEFAHQTIIMVGLHKVFTLSHKIDA